VKPLYIFWGKVKKGRKRGKNLGFPTANISLHKKIPEGIYVSRTFIRKKIFFSATFIGQAKTFAEKDYKAETYILNFNRDIYDEWITIRLFKKIRDNKKFSSEKTLIEQMKKDEEETREYFSDI